MALSPIVSVGFEAQVVERLNRMEKFLLDAKENTNKFKNPTAILPSGVPFGKAIKDSIAPLKQMNDITKSIQSNIDKATRNMIRWAGISTIVSGLLGVGGFFGIDRLAGGAAAARKVAGGSGTSVGENNAFRINYNRYLNNPDAHLAHINDVKNSFDTYKLQRLGVDPTGKNAFQIATELAEKARELYIKGGMKRELAEAQGLTEFYSIDELNRLAASKPGQLEQSAADARRDNGNLNVTSEVGNAWTDLKNQFDRAGQEIETIFTNKLVALEPDLEQLSKEFIELVRAFADSNTLKDGLNAVKNGLHWLAEEIGKPEFKQGFVDLLQGIHDFTVALFKFVNDALGFFGYGPKKQGDNPNAASYDPKLDPKSPEYDGGKSDPKSPNYISHTQKFLHLTGAPARDVKPYVPDPRGDVFSGDTPPAPTPDATTNTPADNKDTRENTAATAENSEEIRKYNERIRKMIEGDTLNPQTPPEYRPNFPTTITPATNFTPGAAQMHNASDPRGIRNNNPGNIDFAGQAGATREIGHNGKSAHFNTMEEGVAELRGLLERYELRGDDTLEKMMNIYAPRSDGNDTAGYIANLSSKMKIGPNTKLDPNNAQQMKTLMQGIMNVEVGGKWVPSDQVIDNGIALYNQRRGNAGTPSQVNIHVSNTTGGSAVVTTNGLVHPG